MKRGGSGSFGRPVLMLAALTAFLPGRAGGAAVSGGGAGGGARGQGAHRGGVVGRGPSSGQAISLPLAFCAERGQRQYPNNRSTTTVNEGAKQRMPHRLSMYPSDRTNNRKDDGSLRAAPSGGILDWPCR